MGYGMKLAIFVACISFTMYLAGFTSPFSSLLFMGTEINWLTLITNIILTPMGIITTVGAAVLFAAALITRSSLIDYILKVSLILAVGNIFVLPIRELILTESVLPVPYNIFFFVILNIMFIGAILSFISGDGW